MRQMNSPSTTKQGDLFISPCNFSEPLFPLDKSPHEWRSCHDAYTYTWTKDFSKDLVSLTSTDSAKMINSMGFCPQNRCQLFNLSATNVDGMAPEGLCYTKIENGGMSYGACAFREGAFNSGLLIGFYNRTQPSPKPIYKKSRIVLGNRRGVLGGNDESMESFINANEIYPGLIGTQCPLASRPAGFENTVDDVKKMIIENNITLWIQLAPSGLDTYFVDGVYKAGGGNCGVFPLEFFMDSASIYSKGVSDFKITQGASSETPYIEMSYTLTAYTQEQNDGRIRTTFDDMSIRRLSNRTLDSVMSVDMPSLRNLRHPSAPDDGQLGGNSSADTVAKVEDLIENAETSELENLSMKGNMKDIVKFNATLSFTKLDTNGMLLGIPMIWKESRVTVKHIWYHKWKDFRTPPQEDLQVCKQYFRIEKP